MSETCKKCGGSGKILDKNKPGFMSQISTTGIDFIRHYVDCDECRDLRKKKQEKA